MWKGSGDPPPLKWSDLRYVFDIKEDCNGKDKFLTPKEVDRLQDAARKHFCLQLLPLHCSAATCRNVPCVDGSELARLFLHVCRLVGAAMCSAC
jgi:hypothetical protein